MLAILPQKRSINCSIFSIRRSYKFVFRTTKICLSPILNPFIVKIGRFAEFKRSKMAYLRLYFDQTP